MFVHRKSNILKEKILLMKNKEIREKDDSTCPSGTKWTFLASLTSDCASPYLWSSPPRETSAIWALKFHTDDVLTRIRSNESDRSIYLTPRNSKAKRKARRQKAKSCLGIFFKSASMMFVASFKLSPFGKSSFRRSILLFVDKMSLSICRRDLVNRWYSRVLLKVGMPECCNAAMPEIESRNTKTRKHQNKAPDR